MISLSQVYRGIKELPGDWRLSQAIFRSPAAKSLAFIPIFGYFLLLNTEFRGWLSASEFEQFVGSDPLSTLKQVYYGGWMILGALYIHHMFCPGIVKSAPTLEEFEISFRSTGHATDVISMIFQAARTPAIFGDQHSRSSGFADQSRQLIERLQSCRGVRTFGHEQVDQLVAGITNAPVLSDADYRNLAQFEDDLYRYAAANSDDSLVRHYSQSLANGFYVENAKVPVFWRMHSNAFAVIGALLILSPAVLALSRIVQSDLGIKLW